MKSIPLFGVVNTDEMEESVMQVMRSGQIASGSHVAAFEAGLGASLQAMDVVSMVDMTSAIYMALHLSGVKSGDEVLTTAFSCMATNAAIAQIGARPVWVDVAPRSVMIDLDDLDKKISPRTRALILYHVAGYPGPAAELAELCTERGIAFIEDCNNALFAETGGKMVGTHGDFGVFSFYPNRQINTSEGGALVCKDKADAARARRLRRFGIDATRFRDRNGEICERADIPEVGWSLTMNNLCASMGVAQLHGAPGRTMRARDNVDTLRELIGVQPGILYPMIDTATVPSYWVMLVFVESRDVVLAHMKQRGINVSKLHQRNDQYSGFHTGTSLLPNTTYLQDHVLAIPCGWWLTDDDLAAIAAELRAAVSGANA